MSERPGAARTGAVHDVGYRRYVGSRLPASARWQVIVRHQVATAWKTWWRYKAWLAVAVIVMVAACVVMFAWRTGVVPLMGKNGPPMKIDDAILPTTTKFFRGAGFLVTLTVGAGAIAGDASSGAFTFYFSRPVRPIDYLAGKLGGMVVLMATLMLVPLVLLALFRIGMSRDGQEVVATLGLFPRAVGVGALGAVTFAAVPLGISALVPNRRNAIIAWAAYYVMIGGLFGLVGALTGTSLGALDLALAYQSVADAAFGLQLGPLVGKTLMPSATWSLVSMLVQTALALVLAYRRIQASAVAGVGEP